MLILIWLIFQNFNYSEKKNNNFQSDWNTTIINKPDLTGYAKNTNLNSISSYDYLKLSGTNANLNSLSNYSYLNITGTNSNLNCLSSYSFLKMSGQSNNITNLALSTANLNASVVSLS